MDEGDRAGSVSKPEKVATKGAWWGSGEDVAGGIVEATDEERALLEAMDAAATAALSNDEVAKK